MIGGLFSGAVGFGKGFLAGAKAGGTAFVQSAVDIAKGGYALATDAGAREQAWQTTKKLANGAVDYAGRAYNDPAKAYRDARDGAAAMYSAFDDARREAEASGQGAEFWGQMAGRGAFEVAAMAAPMVGAASKAGWAAKTGQVVGHVGKAGKAAKAAGYVNKSANAADDMADLANAGARARSAGIGGTLPDASICTQGCPYASGGKAAGKAGSNADDAALTAGRLIAERKAKARKFYQDAGFDEGRIDSHMAGIDFTQEVEIVELPAGTKLAQWQVPGGGKGKYFASVSETPSRLGISPMGDDLAVPGRIVSKVQTTYVSDRPLSALKSTAAPVKDTWSSKFSSVQTEGGGTQFFVPWTDGFQ